MLSAADELRHRWNDNSNWRESVYFTLADVENRIGAWIYLWVLPNKEGARAGIVVCFYSGIIRRPDAVKVAERSPGHLLVEDDGSWLYSFHANTPEPLDADFDEVELHGLRLRRRSPLQTYEISFDDGEGGRAELTYEFTSPPWDYADGLHESPPYLADNRYHRSARISGEVTIGGVSRRIEATGDTDHSWGMRDFSEMGRGEFNLWAIQDPACEMTCSAVRLRRPGDERRLGFVQIGGEMQSVDLIEDAVSFGPGAIQQDIELDVTDAAGRRLLATLTEPFAAICLGVHRPGWGWGYEAVGAYEVEGYGTCAGNVGYFWPSDVTQEDLVARGRSDR
jgi:hypothetical protein